MKVSSNACRGCVLRGLPEDEFGCSFELKVNLCAQLFDVGSEEVHVLLHLVTGLKFC